MDKTEHYTPGHTANAVEFMSRRSLESHGAFLIPYLEDAMSVLDCGCVPGSITFGIADRIPKGRVIGVDIDDPQIGLARIRAAERGLKNVEFRRANAYDLPFPFDTFDAVFAHALLEHLRVPGDAIGEFRRVLRQGGTLAVCSPDWGGFLLAPPSHTPTAAVEAYKSLQTANGGDVYVGRKLPQLLEAAAFQNSEIQARYETYESLEFIGEYLAAQLEDAGQTLHAATFREWAARPNGMFAQSWVSCVSRKGSHPPLRER